MTAILGLHTVDFTSNQVNDARTPPATAIVIIGTEYSGLVDAALI